MDSSVGTTTGVRRSVERACSAAAWAVAAVAFVLLVWRASLPNEQHRDSDVAGVPTPGELWAQHANGYDDVVTVVTARNFVHDGFWRTHLLPNRRFAPLASYLDFGREQCLSLGGERETAPVYRNVWGEWIAMDSLTRDCIYTHYPPLADWVFGLMAVGGLESIFCYRVLAIAVSCFTLVLLHRWLSREVHPGAALAATALLAISPAFFQWAGALFYVTFQYFFLLAGVVAWCGFLEERKVRWFALTFLLFFLEALVSYELVLFFAILLVGLAAMDGKGAGWGRRLGWVAIQAAAPLTAVLLHLGLRVSLFGLAATWQNLVATALNRSEVGWTVWREQTWWNRIEIWLMRLDLAALAVVLVLAVRLARRARPWRAAALLALTLAGGLSFMAVFPGTAWVHSWMMYRHLFPAASLLLALAIDGAILCLRPGPAVPVFQKISAAPRRGLAVAIAVTLLVPAAWSLRQGFRGVQGEIAWLGEANRHHDPANQAVRYLDVLHWFEDGPPTYDLRARWAVDGQRVDRLRDPSSVFLMRPERHQHFEIWWLDEIAPKEVRILTRRGGEELLTSFCAVTAFDGIGFRPVGDSRGSVEPFQPEAGDPTDPTDSYVWWRMSFETRTRAIRLSCRGLPRSIPLHEVEVR